MNDYDRNKQRKPERIKFLVKDYNSSIEGIRSLIWQSVYRGRTLLLHISFSRQRTAFSEKVTTLLFIYTQRLSN